MSRVTRSIRFAFAAVVATLALPAPAQMAPWEQALYDAAKKEAQFTVYTAHYDTETIADICAAFDASTRESSATSFAPPRRSRSSGCSRT